ncbi:MAG: metallophosphoesterase [Acidobacteria bacterium]|nr:metallophosphoesterase [Acidobacteriota bacterium]
MRRHFLLLIATALLGADPSVEFLLVTDTHVVNLAGVHPALAGARAHFAQTGTALSAFLSRAAEAPKPDFLLHTGDLTDAFCFDRASGPPVCEGVAVFKPLLKQIPVPAFLALGNHDIQTYRQVEGKPAADYAVAPRARQEWAAAAECFRDGTYYSFERRAGRARYVFLVLDNGERRLAKDSVFSAAQLTWLRKQVAAQRDATLILVMHVPLGEDAYSAELKSALAGSDRVMLSIAGHRHSDGIEDLEVNGRRLVQVRTAAFGYGEGNWRRFRLLEEGIEVRPTGRTAQVERKIPRP